MKPSYRFYATLLDAFNDYLNSDAIWNKYWGFSENPPHDPEEFHEQQFKELIDRINRQPFDSEAADRGTAFNEVIDCMIENRKSDTVIVERVYSSEVDFCQDDVNRNCHSNAFSVILTLPLTIILTIRQLADRICVLVFLRQILNQVQNDGQCHSDESQNHFLISN